MTVTQPTAGATSLALTRGRVTAAVAQRATRKRLVLAAILALFLISFVRVWTDAKDLTSSGTFEAALRLAVPILLAGLGGLYAERSGVVNIGLEGMMILGTWFGAWAAWQWGPWYGVVFGVLAGAVGGLVHAVATITFEVNHIVSGVAINILAAGVARYLSSIAYTPDTGGGVQQSPIIPGHIGHMNLPILAGGSLFGWDSPDFFGWVEDKHWFFVSDLAAMLRGLTGNISWLTVIAIALVPFTYWLLWRTRFGVRLRSVGENPSAAESLGVPVYTMKYIAVSISGALAGLAGAFLVLVSAGVYREGQTGGRGFIGLAAMIFGNWRPVGVGVGALLFGFTDALQLRSGDAVHALLLFVGIGVAWNAVWALRRRKIQVGALLAVIAAGFILWYLRTDRVPEEFVAYTPHVTTLIVLASATQRLRMPAADGLPYRKGQVQ